MLLVALSGCVTKYVETNQDYDISDVCDNLQAFQGNSRFYSETEENNETVGHIEKFNFIGGIVIYNNYSNNNNGGLVVITGKKQILANETEAKFIAVAVEDPDQVKELSVGSVVKIENIGINWQSQNHDGKEYWFIDNPGRYLVKTGQVPANDPIYDEVQQAIQEFRDEQAMDNILVAYYILFYLNPSMPTSPLYFDD